MTPSLKRQVGIALNRVEELLPPRERETYFAEMRRRYEICLGELIKAGAVETGKKVLDIGLSPGYMALAFVFLGLEVHGLDYDPDNDFLGDGVNRRRWLESFGIKVHQCDVQEQNIPLADETMDLVTFNETIEHLSDKPHKPVCEIARVLKPGGFLLLTTPNVVSFKRRMDFLLGKNVFSSVEEYCDLSAYKRHNREYTMPEIRWLVQRCGLEPFYSRHINFSLLGPNDSSMKKIFAAPYRLMTLLFPSFSSGLLLLAKKPADTRIP